MKKSTYSLILSEDVVEAVDRLAYSMKTSRSNLINEILAKHVSYVTPERRMREILSRTQRLLHASESYFFPEMQSASFLDIRAALKYKYKPTIRYCVELYPGGTGALGELRISLRTQSERLMADIADFFEVWESLENQYLRAYYPAGVPFEAENGIYVRHFYLPKGQGEVSEEALGQAIAQYVSALDSTLKIFLGSEPEKILTLVNRNYRSHLETAELIL